MDFGSQNRSQELSIEHICFPGSVRHKESKSIIQYGLTARYIMKHERYHAAIESLLKERVSVKLPIKIILLLSVARFSKTVPLKKHLQYTLG